jgi:hypothetical protein
MIWMAPLSPINEGTRAAFVRWEDGLANNSRTVHISSNQTLSAEYKTQHFINITTSAGGTVNLGSSWFDEGSIVTLTAIPSSGYRFDNFTMMGGITLLSQNGSIATLQLNGPGTVIPNFVAIPLDYTLYYIIALVAIAATIGSGIYLAKKRGKWK